jgi:hypothetical protein
MIYLNIHTGCIARVGSNAVQKDESRAIVQQQQMSGDLNGVVQNVEYVIDGNHCTLIHNKLFSNDEKVILFKDVENKDNWKIIYP